MPKGNVSFSVIIFFRTRAGEFAAEGIREFSLNDSLSNQLFNVIPITLRAFKVNIKLNTRFRAFWFGENSWIEDVNSPVSPEHNNDLLFVVDEQIADSGIDFYTMLAKQLSAYEDLIEKASRRHFSYEYDVALSYAGEDSIHADALAEALRRRNLNVFYDKYEKTTLWGKNLYTYLSDIYQKKARYCVMFLSKYYAAKLWTNHEREAAQARAFSENKEYILPVRLDDTVIPGMLPTVAYLTWPPETAETIADAIMEKLGKAP